MVLVLTRCLFHCDLPAMKFERFSRRHLFHVKCNLEKFVSVLGIMNSKHYENQALKAEVLGTGSKFKIQYLI